MMKKTMIGAMVTAAVLTATAGEWSFPRTTPESQGIRSEAVIDLIDRLEKKNADWPHAYMLIRHGKVVAEGWWAPYDAATRHQLYSASKGFVSLAIGYAVEDRKLTLNDRVNWFFPWYVPPEQDERASEIRVRDLLAMSSGQAQDAAGAMLDAQRGMVPRAFFSVPMAERPGLYFNYHNGNTMMLAEIHRRVTGEADMLRYLKPRLFDPLGFGEIAWERNPDGIDIGGWGLWLSVEEIAAFAQLWLQGGVWDGRQLIPRDYVAMASRKQIENATIPWGGPPDWNQGYGFQFWMCRYNCFRGDGYAGQIALMMPEHDIAVAITAGSGDIQAELDAAYVSLMNAVKHRALPVDAAALASLRTCEAQLRLALPPPAGPNVAFPAESYRMAENRLGLLRVALAPAASGAAVALTLEFGDRTAVFEAGFDADIRTRTAFAYPEPLDLVARAAWSSANELVVNILPIGTPSWFTLDFAFAGNRLTYRQRTPIWFRHETLLDVSATGTRMATE